MVFKNMYWMKLLKLIFKWLGVMLLKKVLESFVSNVYYFILLNLRTE